MRRTWPPRHVATWWTHLTTTHAYNLSVQSLSLRASEDIDVPQVLPCITTTLPPNYFQKQSRWECCRSGGPPMEGGPFKG